MPSEIIYEQQILNGSTFYTLHNHTDPAECWKHLAKCLHLYKQKDSSIRSIKVDLGKSDMMEICVLYASSRRDLFHIPFESF